MLRNKNFCRSNLDDVSLLMTKKLWEDVKQTQLQHGFGLLIGSGHNVAGSTQRRRQNHHIIALVHHLDNSGHHPRLNLNSVNPLSNKNRLEQRSARKFLTSEGALKNVSNLKNHLDALVGPVSYVRKCPARVGLYLLVFKVKHANKGRQQLLNVLRFSRRILKRNILS